ncbi:SMC-Scp complex subunit ScpB [Roseiconus lacunae]|uniref:SMC-Scp complex subunit ScpB n=1 Tax=Roseiconus lacunae TaxID=2605694 RepID=UPI002AA5D538
MAFQHVSKRPSVYAMQHFQSYRNALQRLGEDRRGHPLSRLQPPYTRCRRPYSVVQTEIGSNVDADRNAIASSGQPAEDEDPLDRRMRLEAVLLLAKSPLTTRKLAQMAHLADGTEARTLVRQLNQLYDELGRAVRIEQVAGGYRLLSRAAYAPWLGRLEHLPSAIRLSSPMMETLAVVAYRGPVSRADVEAIRGVACGELLRQLMERDLIRISGRSEELGRPYLYDTTKYFLEVFGLPSTDALPPIDWDPLTETPAESDPKSSTSNFDL